MATSQFAAPLYAPKFQVLDANGNPLSGGFVYTYVAGTATPLPTYPTYADALAGTNANANPVTLDSAGRADIWLTTALYKIVVTDSAFVMVYTADSVGSALGFPQPYPTEWTKETGTLVYSSATAFKVSGQDVTAIYHTGRRIKTQNTGGTVYSTVTSSSFATDTTVNVVNDSGTLDAGLSAAWYGITSFANRSYLDPVTVVSSIKNGDQTAIGAAAKITAWTEQIDTLSEFTTPTFTAKYPGKYMVQVSLAFSDTNADAVVTGYIYVSGSPVTESVHRADDTATEIKTMALHWVGTLAAGATVEVYAAGTATTIKGTSGSRFSVTRIVGA